MHGRDGGEDQSESVPRPLEYRNHDDELDLETSYAYTVWFDWPEELLATDDKTSIRLVFEGLAINRGVDAFRRMRARVTFEYGAEAFADVTRCVEDHRKGGRLDAPPMDLDIETPPLLLPPGRW